MMKLILATWVFIFFSQSVIAKSRDLNFTTLEAPPFISEQLPEQGGAVFAMRTMFKNLGYNLNLKFYPMRRAKAEALKESQYTGFLPATHNDLEEGFILSKTIFQTTSLLIENVEKPIPWNKPEDLGAYKGSFVVGYSLKSPMAELYESGKLHLEESPDEVSSLLKVANRRVDFAFINDGMYKFLISNDPRLKDVAKKLKVSVKPAAIASWGLAFKKDDPASMKVLKEFNEKIDPEEFTKLVGLYFKKMQAAKAAGSAAPATPVSASGNPVASPSATAASTTPSSASSPIGK